MRVVPLWGRQTGKTTRLVKMSADTLRPIICGDERRKQNVMENARLQGLEIPEPLVAYTAREKLLQWPHAREVGVLIDDLEYVLDQLLGVHVVAVTMDERPWVL